MVKDLIIWGYYGVNLGDDVMLRQLIDNYNGKCLVHVVLTESTNPEKVEGVDYIVMPEFESRKNKMSG